MILPACAIVAPQIGKSEEAISLFNYTGLINLLEYCAGVVPIRKVKKDEQIYQSKWRDRTSELLKESMMNSEGLPIGI